MQESIANWGELLMAAGGALKPIKCFYHLISFRWKANGDWAYVSHEEDEDFAIGVPMPDGRFVEIDHHSVHTAQETLGVMTSPSGTSPESLQQIRDKAQG